MAFREKMKDGTTRISGPPRDPWPVNSVYISMSIQDPHELFGGTWVRFAAGRMLVGVNEGDVDFEEAGMTGGEKEHTLDVFELPLHEHTMWHGHEADSANSGGHSHSTNRRVDAGGAGGVAYGGGSTTSDVPTSFDGGHDHAVTVDDYLDNTGASGWGQPHNNMPPYITVYMFRRTA